MLYRFETSGKLSEINHEDICINAKFKLDKPLTVTIYDVFSLIDGQWYIIIDSEPHRLQGRWVDERASNSGKNIKVSKKPRIRDS